MWSRAVAQIINASKVVTFINPASICPFYGFIQ